MYSKLICFQNKKKTKTEEVGIIEQVRKKLGGERIVWIFGITVGGWVIKKC